MTFTALILELDAGEADRLSDTLLEAGALSVSGDVAPPGTPEETSFLAESDGIAAWPRLKLMALCRRDDDPEQLLSRACVAAGIAAPAYEMRSVADEDWVKKSQDQFAPIRVSARLWVVPSWHVPPDPNAINLVLDPGLAFGTGCHPSTRLCLEWLERTVAGGETVLDYGCGSGILAIAALKLGARRAVGVDIDANAVSAARANAVRNGVGGQFFEPPVPHRLSADLVVANILANPLKVLAPLLASHCVRGGRLALSGILAPQAKEVEECYAAWIAFGPPILAEEWACLSGVRF